MRPIKPHFKQHRPNNARAHTRQAGLALIEASFAIIILIVLILFLIDVSLIFVRRSALLDAAVTAGIWGARQSANCADEAKDKFISTVRQSVLLSSRFENALVEPVEIEEYSFTDFKDTLGAPYTEKVNMLKLELNVDFPCILFCKFFRGMESYHQILRFPLESGKGCGV